MANTTQSVLSCPICTDVFQNDSRRNISALRCGHFYHESCLLTWLHTRLDEFQPQNCPECRRLVVARDIIRLYPHFSGLDANNVPVAPEEAPAQSENRESVEDSPDELDFFDTTSNHEMDFDEFDLDADEPDSFSFGRLNTHFTSAHRLFVTESFERPDRNNILNNLDVNLERLNDELHQMTDRVSHLQSILSVSTNLSSDADDDADFDDVAGDDDFWDDCDFF